MYIYVYMYIYIMIHLPGNKSKWSCAGSNFAAVVWATQLRTSATHASSEKPKDIS